MIIFKPLLAKKHGLLKQFTERNESNLGFCFDQRNFLVSYISMCKSFEFSRSASSIAIYDFGGKSIDSYYLTSWSFERIFHHSDPERIDEFSVAKLG